MVSRNRKKSKGKERKVKKLEDRRARVRGRWWKYVAREKDATGRVVSVICEHGCGILPSDIVHPVSRFMDEFMT